MDHSKKAGSAGMGVMALLTFLFFAATIFFQIDERQYMKGQGMMNPAADELATTPVLSP